MVDVTIKTEVWLMGGGPAAESFIRTVLLIIAIAGSAGDGSRVSLPVYYIRQQAMWRAASECDTVDLVTYLQRLQYMKQSPVDIMQGSDQCQQFSRQRKYTQQDTYINWSV